MPSRCEFTVVQCSYQEQSLGVACRKRNANVYLHAVSLRTRKATTSFTASNPKLWKYQYFKSTCLTAHLVEHPVTPGDAEWKHTSHPRTPCYTGQRGMKTHKSCNNTLLHRATRNENTQVIQEHPVTPGNAEWKHTSLLTTPCYTGQRGMKTHKSSNNTLLHRATRNEKHTSLPRTPRYTGRRGMKTHTSSKNTLLHSATQNENTDVFEEHPVTPGDAEWKHTSLLRTPRYTGRRRLKNTSHPRTPCYTGRRGMKTQVFYEHPVTPGDAEWKHKSHPRTSCYTGRHGMKT